MQGLISACLTWYSTRTARPNVVQEVIVGKASWREGETDVRVCSMDENRHEQRGDRGLHFHVSWRKLEARAPCCKSGWVAGWFVHCSVWILYFICRAKFGHDTIRHYNEIKASRPKLQACMQKTKGWG